MKLPTPSRSISATLTRMNLLVICIALSLVYLSFLAYNLLSFREAAVGSLTAEAQIVGSNCVSAILFNDRSLAQNTLTALTHSSEVVAAAVYTAPDNKLLAQYPVNGRQPPQPRAVPKGESITHWVSGVNILIASPVVSHGNVIGTVYLQARLHNLTRQVVRYTAITGGILLFCLCVALMAGSVFRTILAKPIVALAETARRVSRSRDYSLRFHPERNYDELASLTEAFNEMLAEIQRRDAALEQSRANLEQRVVERTLQLEAANQELESFSYTVAHDLRSPLQAIVNVSFLLGQRAGDPAYGTAPMLHQLRASVSEMSKLIDDLLNLSRSATLPLQLAETDLSQIAASELKSLADADPARDVEVHVEPGCHTAADAGLMTIALQNLLRNAWKFTSRRSGARIEFGAAETRGTRFFYVRDNGAGFDPRLSERLFKPFQRLHSSSDFPGTGIGLATVQRIVRRHGGEVWAEGGLDRGASFYFTLHALRPNDHITAIANPSTEIEAVPSA
jgi:signal transduction histidine kinase